MMKYISVLVFVLIVIACRPIKRIQTAVTPRDTATLVVINNSKVDSNYIKQEIFEKVYSNAIQFNYFSAKAKIDFTDTKGKNTDVTGFIRISKDSLIWLSLTGALGIEGFRILISPDSVAIMNKLDNEISYRTVSYLQDMIKLPVDFYTLQDLIVGNLVFFPKNIVSYKQTGSQLQALAIGNFFKHLVTIDTTDNRIVHSKLDDVETTRSRTCDITLDDYVKTEDKLFSKKREIIVTEKEKLKIGLNFKQFDFNKPQSFPFNIPQNYKIK